MGFNFERINLNWSRDPTAEEFFFANISANDYKNQRSFLSILLDPVIFGHYHFRFFEI